MCTVYGTKIDYLFGVNNVNRLNVSIFILFYLISNTNNLQFTIYPLYQSGLQFDRLYTFLSYHFWFSWVGIRGFHRNYKKRNAELIT